MQKYLVIVMLVWSLTAGLCFAGPTPSRIVSLAPNLTEILFELGLANRVAGVTSFCDYPPEAAVKPKIGGMTNPSLEAVVALKPDLVVMTVDGNPPQFKRKLAKVGIKTYVFKAARIAELPQAIRELGEALGVRKRAEVLARRIEKGVEKYRAASRSKARGRAVFIMQTEPLMIAGKGTAIDEVMEVLGLKNIAPRKAGSYPRITLEELIAQSPDMIFIAQYETMGESSSAFLKKLAAIDAVKEKRVYWMGDSLFRMGPRIVEGIRQMDAAISGGKK